MGLLVDRHGVDDQWKVKIKQSEVLRLNAIYNTQNASWYENMGIVVALVAPAETEREDALHGGPGIDVFEPGVVLDNGLPDLATPVPGWPMSSARRTR